MCQRVVWLKKWPDIQLYVGVCVCMVRAQNKLLYSHVSGFAAGIPTTLLKT
jgi:hypothetical protein